MAALRELKDRIGSVASTQKTTSAMKMISSAKMHKAVGQLQRLKPYRGMVQTVMGHLLGTDMEFSSPLIESREVKNLAFAVFGSDDGLCGAYNVNIYKQLKALIADTQKQRGSNVGITILPVGKKIAKAAQSLSSASVKVETLDYISTRSSQEQLGKFTDVLRNGFLEGRFDMVSVVYVHFISNSRQRLQVDQLLPVDYAQLAADADKTAANSPCIFEPDANSIFNSVLPLHLRSTMQEIFTESAASEQCARVMAMQTASDNARDLLDQLNLEYNKLRQESITTELLDIAGGQIDR
ncbi:MAG: ATP synthase F1 subunit gamma [Sodaliphilus sp.]|nr:ATP synthase F1 subunit gamma [Sodaliphilus sp.]